MAASLALAVVLEASDRHFRRASSAVSRGIFVKYFSLLLFLLSSFLCSCTLVLACSRDEATRYRALDAE